MFQLAILKDSVRIAPSAFGKEFQQAIVDELNSKYSNRIVHNLGLCVCVYDLLAIEDPIVHPGEGASFIKGISLATLIAIVKFRLTIFRPFVGELCVGKVQSCDEDGLRISVGFFDDIFVPFACMKPNTAL